jgi:hypothetical protein
MLEGSRFGVEMVSDTVPKGHPRAATARVQAGTMAPQSTLGPELPAGSLW